MKEKKRGRPRSINSTRVQFSLDPLTISGIDKIAKATDRSKSATIRRLVDAEQKRIGV